MWLDRVCTDEDVRVYVNGLRRFAVVRIRFTKFVFVNLAKQFRRGSVE